MADVQTLDSPFSKAARALGFAHWDMLLPDPSSIPFRKFIAYLENQKIRIYKEKDRNICKKVGDKRWQQMFQKYLQDLGCPFPFAVFSLP